MPASIQLIKSGDKEDQMMGLDTLNLGMLRDGDGFVQHMEKHNAFSLLTDIVRECKYLNNVSMRAVLK